MAELLSIAKPRLRATFQPPSGTAAVSLTCCVPADRQATLQPSKPGACVQHLDVYRDRHPLLDAGLLHV